MKRPRDINIVIGIGIFAVIAIVLYWFARFIAPAYIQARTPATPDYHIYVNFEQAFPLADGWLAISTLLGVIGLWKMRDWGFLFMLLSGSSGIFLGLMDLLYDLEHHMFVPLTAEAATELLIVILLLVLSPLLILLTWRQRNETGPASRSANIAAQLVCTSSLWRKWLAIRRRHAPLPLQPIRAR